MASRHPAMGVSQALKQRDAAEPAGKQKAPTGAQGKKARVLKNISNTVTARAPEGKVQPQVPQPNINRPITRSFRAQLLAKENAANNKKPIAISQDKPIQKAGKKTVKEVPAKPKLLGVIEISSENGSEIEKQSETSTFASCSKPAKKRVHTLTSVLTARSKVACGITDKPAELVHDIDSGDAEDQLAVVDYIEDIYKFYKQAEHSCRPDDYMSFQVEISAKMRAILADWLIEVHHRFELMPETLYLTFYIIDRYLSIETIIRRELQLAGVAAMLIASKYEEIWAPEVNDFICISDRTYSREQILGMEKGILNKLEWNLTVPTPYMFLVRFLKAARCDKEMEHMVYFFAELGLVKYSMITYCPSMFAASAIFAAQCTLEKSPLWSDTLEFHTGFSKEQLLDCTQILINSHFEAPQSKQTVVYKKYSHEKYGAVALRPAATKLIEEMQALRNLPDDHRIVYRS